MKTSSILLFICALSISIIGKAQTYVSGGIYSNTTWSVSNSPYIVTSDIVVFDGVTLNIQPGVIVKFDLNVGIELRGKLVAIGSVTDSITFTSSLSVPAMNNWKGFKVIGNTNPLGIGNQVTMEYCKGLCATKFMDLDIAYHGPYNFKHCSFSHNYQVNYDGGSPSTIFEDCYFSENNTALNYCQFYSRVSNSQFINNVNGVNGMQNVDSCYFFGNTGIALSPYGSTVACKVENNNIGVSCYFNSANNNFINNEIYNNTIGIDMLTYFNGGSITFTGNTICNNLSYNLKLFTQNNADLSNNCWCTNDSATVRSSLVDGYSNISFGLVSFMPLANSCYQSNLLVNEPRIESIDVSKIYPNPFSESAILEFHNPNSESVAVQIFATSGKQIRSFDGITSNFLELRKENLSNGLYFYQIRNQNGKSQNGKFLIQ
jgi:Secretion system C-terminal sorting domain